MSLIEEALRKQREETEQPGRSVATPPPLPHDPAPESTGEKTVARRPWAMLTGLILLGILSLAFILWLLFFGLHLWQKPPAPAPVPAPAATALKAPATPSPEPVPAPVPKTEPVVVAVTNIPPASPPPAPVTNTVAAPITPSVPLVAPQPTGSTVKVAMPVLWPKLLITGIIGRNKGGESAVIINGQMLSPGDSLEGVKIEGIEKQRAKLVFQGETKLLSVGGTTE